MRAKAGRPRWRSALTLAQAGAGAVALRRLAQGARRRPPLAPAPDVAATARVSVVVPARNEAARIRPCLEALGRDPQVHEVVVVDDESTDGTGVVATGLGARVIAGAPLPPGWVGKPWALHQGLQAATGEWVLTIDADVVPQPGLVAALVARAVTEGWDVLSAGPRFICRDPAQRLLHASMLATLVYRFGPVGPPRPPRASRALANGQCLLVRRAWLREWAGFAVPGGHMTDDIALVRWLSATGAAVGFVDGSQVVEVEMHRSAPEVWREWGRSLPMADVTAAAAQAGDLAVVWLVMALPVIRLLARRPRRLDLGLLAVRVAMAGALRGAYTQGGPPLWLSWLADPLAAARLTQAAVRPVRTWRGRRYGA